jgi:hypothetical protein
VYSSLYSRHCTQHVVTTLITVYSSLCTHHCLLSTVYSSLYSARGHYSHHCVLVTVLLAVLITVLITVLIKDITRCTTVSTRSLLRLITVYSSLLLITALITVKGEPNVLPPQPKYDSGAHCCCFSTNCSTNLNMNISSFKSP